MESLAITLYVMKKDPRARFSLCSVGAIGEDRQVKILYGSVSDLKCSSTIRVLVSDSWLISLFGSPTRSAISFDTFSSSAKDTFAETSNNTRPGLLERAGSFQRSTVRSGPPDTLMFFHTWMCLTGPYGLRACQSISPKALSSATL